MDLSPEPTANAAQSGSPTATATATAYPSAPWHIPKLREGSYFPSLLEPRRRREHPAGSGQAFSKGGRPDQGPGLRWHLQQSASASNWMKWWTRRLTVPRCLDQKVREALATAAESWAWTWAPARVDGHPDKHRSDAHPENRNAAYAGPSTVVAVGTTNRNCADTWTIAGGRAAGSGHPMR